MLPEGRTAEAAALHVAQVAESCTESGAERKVKKARVPQGTGLFGSAGRDPGPAEQKELTKLHHRDTASVCVCSCFSRARELGQA